MKDPQASVHGSDFWKVLETPSSNQTKSPTTPATISPLHPRHHNILYEARKYFWTLSVILLVSLYWFSPFPRPPPVLRLRLLHIRNLDRQNHRPAKPLWNKILLKFALMTGFTAANPQSLRIYLIAAVWSHGLQRQQIVLPSTVNIFNAAQYAGLRLPSWLRLGK